MEDESELHAKLAQYQKENEELKLRNEALEDFVGNAPISLHWIDEQGIIIWANQTELDILGYTAEEYIGKPIKNFHADREVIDDILAKLGDNQAIQNYPSKLKCKDGTIKHVVISSNVLRKDGKFIHTRCFTRDITNLLQEANENAGTLAALKESEARLKLAVELTKLGTWNWLPQSGKLTWSDECREIYGVPPELPVTFELFSELLYPDDKERVQNSINAALASDDGGYEITYRILKYTDRSVRWIRVKGQVFRDLQSVIKRFVGTVVDVTDIKISDDKIAASEKLFKNIALNIPKSLIIVIDKDHRFVTIEGDIMEKMGYNSSSYLGRHAADVSPPERYQATRHLYERVLSGEKFSEERKSDTGEDYMVHFVPLKNDDGEVYAGLIIALDISDIKAAEEKNAKLVAIVESTDDAIVSKTLEGTVTSWNDSAFRTFGYTAEEMIGESILKLIPFDRQHEETEILSRLSKGIRVEHFETRRMRKDGSLIDVSLTISPIRDSAGTIIGLSKIARDITEKNQEQQRKNDFVSIVSHELKTPLTSITGYVQLLLAKSKKEGNEQNINILTRAEAQTKKMAAMIQDFLNLARMEEGKIQLEMTQFELKALVDEIISDPQFYSERHVLFQEIPYGIQVIADRGKIGQVLINLLSNAIKYSPHGGNITISSELIGGSVKISVKDEGIGVNIAHQKRLFDRFYRVNDDRIKSISGFGIGLYLVAEILRYHESAIRLTSEEGLGSTFAFSLKVVAQGDQLLSNCK